MEQFLLDQSQLLIRQKKFTLSKLGNARCSGPHDDIEGEGFPKV